MDSNTKAPIECTSTMLEKRSMLGRNARLEVGIQLAGGQHWSLEKRDGFVEDTLVAGHVEIVGRRVGQPEEIVGHACAHAAAHRFVPPVLYVALNELPRRRLQDLRA